MANTVDFGLKGGLNDYSAELSDIERRRAYAMALQQQGMTPMGGTETVGGWAIKRSPMEGLGKVLQAYAGERGQEKASEEQRALGERYQSDLARTMMQAQAAGAGSPGRAAQMDEDSMGIGRDTPAQAGVAPDRQAMARILMGHPETRGLALQQMQQDMQRQGFMAAGGMAAPQGGAGAAQGAPAMAGQGGAPAAPQGAPGGFGGPAGGQPMALWLQLDPTGKAYTEQLAKDHAERGKPVVNRGYGIGTMNAQGQYVADPASVAQARQVEEMKAGIHAGYAPPVSIPMSGGQSASVFPPEFQGVRQTGQPPARLGGAQAPASPSARPPGFPRESPEELKKAGADSLRLLQGEAAQFTRTGQPVPAGLQQEIANAQKMAAGQYPKSANPVSQAGPGTLGLTQPQGDAIAQAGETEQAKTYGRERGQLLASKPQAEAAATASIQSLDRVVKLANELHDHEGLSGVTGKINQYSTGDITPTTRAARGLQNSLVNQVGIQALQAMRDASKTGGAVGNVTEKEWPILQQSIAALDASQGTPDYQKALVNLDTQIRQSMARVKRAYEQTYGEPLSVSKVPHTTQGRRAEGNIKPFDPEMEQRYQEWKARNGG